MRTDSVVVGGAHEAGLGTVEPGLNGSVRSLGELLDELARLPLTHPGGESVEVHGRGHETLSSSSFANVLAWDTFKILGHLPDCSELGPWRAQARALLRSADRLARGSLARADPVPIRGAHKVKPGAIQAGLNGSVESLGAFFEWLARPQLTHPIYDLVDVHGRRRESLCSSTSTNVLAGDTFKILDHLPDCSGLGPWRAQARALLRSGDRLVRGRLARLSRCHSRRLDARPRSPRRLVPAGRQPESSAAGGGGDGSAGDGGGGGSDPGELGGDGDPDAEASAVESGQRVVCRGGRHGS